jgi:hypothetical protein
MRMKLLFKLLATLLCTGTTIGCGEVLQHRFLSGRGGLSGKVVDAQGVETQALITLYYENRQESFRMESGADGRFSINDLPVGDPLIVAADLLGNGNLAYKQVIVCADEIIDVGTLRLGVVDDFNDVSAIYGRRLTAGAGISDARISRSGKSLVYRVVDTVYPCTHSSHPCKWYLVQERADGNWRPIGTLETHNLYMLGLDDQWIYGNGQDGIWRTRTDDLENNELGDRVNNIHCSDVSVAGPVCWTHVDSGSADLTMPGDLLLWRPDDPQPSILVAREPNGMVSFPRLSPDGKRVAYVPRKRGELTGNQRIVIDLTSGIQQVETAENVIDLEFDPFGRPASLDVDSQGRVYFRSQPISKAIMLPLDPIVDPDSIIVELATGIYFDAYRQVWTVWVNEDATDDQYRMFHIKSDTLSVTEKNPATIHGYLWRANTQGKVAFEYDHHGYNKIFTSHSGSKYPLTIVNQPHYLIGWSSDGQSVIYMTSEPASGLYQILSLRVPEQR